MAFVVFFCFFVYLYIAIDVTRTVGSIRIVVVVAVVIICPSGRNAFSKILFGVQVIAGDDCTSTPPSAGVGVVVSNLHTVAEMSQSVCVYIVAVVDLAVIIDVVVLVVIVTTLLVRGEGHQWPCTDIVFAYRPAEGTCRV